MFWLRNIKNNFQLRTLILGPAVDTLIVFLKEDEKINFEKKKKISRRHKKHMYAFLLSTVTIFFFKINVFKKNREYHHD